MSDNVVPPSQKLPAGRQWLIVAAVAALAVAAACMDYLFSASSTASAAGAPPATAMQNFKPTAEQLAGLTVETVPSLTFHDETSTDGYIAVDDDHVTPVFSQFSGRVTKIFAKIGDPVRKGYPLLAIEAAEFAQAKNELIVAKAQYTLAATNEKRQHSLYDAQGAPLKDWQQAQLDLATAEAALGAVRSRLKISGMTDAAIAALENAPEATAINAEIVISAPISGVVTQRQVGLGQYIQAGAANPVYSIGDLSTVWLIANVRESDAPQVHVGDAIEVRVLAFPGRLFKATISYVAPSIDPATRRLMVRADVDNRNGALKSQMFADFNIITGADRTAPGVPQDAIVYDGNEARVWIALPDGSLALRNIETGRSNGAMVEVTKGLAAGERVVTKGAIFIDRAATNT